MKAKGITLKLAMIFLASTNFSCVKAPVVFSYGEAVDITEEDTKKIADDIKRELHSINFTPDGYVAGPTIPRPEDCQAAFNTWIDKHLDNGLIPKMMVSALEYAKDQIPSNALLAQCPSIDTEKEFEEAIKDASADQQQKKSAYIFDLEDLQNAIDSDKCARNFINPNKMKININNMSVKVDKNSLNVKSPKYNIYYGSHELDEDSFLEPGAEKAFTDKGDIVNFAYLDKIPAHFTGKKDLVIDKSSEQFNKAQKELGSLDSNLIAIPEVLSQEKELIRIANQDYYLIPKGMMRLYLVLEISLKGEIADALCVLKQVKEKAKEKDNERRKVFEAR